MGKGLKAELKPDLLPKKPKSVYAAVSVFIVVAYLNEIAYAT